MYSESQACSHLFHELTPLTFAITIRMSLHKDKVDSITTVVRLMSNVWQDAVMNYHVNKQLTALCNQEKSHLMEMKRKRKNNGQKRSLWVKYSSLSFHCLSSSWDLPLAWQFTICTWSGSMSVKPLSMIMTHRTSTGGETWRERRRNTSG